MRLRYRWLALSLVVLVGIFLRPLGRLAGTASGHRQDSAFSGSTSSQVFTPAHRTVLDAVRDFFNWQPAPVQPVAFTHKVHLANGMECTNCHAGVDQGPDAGLPSVKLCMMCHQAIDTNNPEIKKVAAYFNRGEEIPWERVYRFSPYAHVEFNHAPHISAGVNCSVCHGDLKKQTVAVRSVNPTMGFCVNCHKQRKVSIDCMTCHF